MSAKLIGLAYSPWTERARWALEARKVDYQFVPYVPLVGEPRLRLLLNRWRGPVSVPILVADGEAIPDSSAIGRWADQRGSGPTLFPADDHGVVERMIDASERGLSAGRARSLARTVDDEAALAELVPKGIGRVIGRRAGIAIARFGVKRTRRKYRGDAASDDAHAAVFTGALDEVRHALAGRATILPAFSYADIAASQLLVYVMPPASGLRLGEANRNRFADAELAERYADLVRWRDALYATYR